MPQIEIPETKDIAKAVASEIQRLGLTANPEWVTADELAKRLQMSKQQVETLAAHGVIPCKDFALPGASKRMLRFSVAAVEKWFLETK